MLFWSVKFSISPMAKLWICTEAPTSGALEKSVTVNVASSGWAVPPPW